MKKVLPIPSKELLSERLNYDPETGKLFWKQAAPHHFKTKKACNRFNSTMAGKEAGHKHLQGNGSRHAIVIRVSLHKKDIWLLAHRIIYGLMGIDVPNGMEIDHINRNPWDNRWVNLRLATPSQNIANSVRKLGLDGLPRTLPKGVSIQAGRYKAQICVNGKKRHIGMYGTPEEAAEAYRREASPHHGEFFLQPSTTRAL